MIHVVGDLGVETHVVCGIEELSVQSIGKISTDNVRIREFVGGSGFFALAALHFAKIHATYQLMGSSKTRSFLGQMDVPSALKDLFGAIQPEEIIDCRYDSTFVSIWTELGRNRRLFCDSHALDESEGPLNIPQTASCLCLLSASSRMLLGNPCDIKGRAASILVAPNRTILNKGIPFASVAMLADILVMSVAEFCILAQTSTVEDSLPTILGLEKRASIVLTQSANACYVLAGDAREFKLVPLGDKSIPVVLGAGDMFAALLCQRTSDSRHDFEDCIRWAHSKTFEAQNWLMRSLKPYLQLGQ